jgi:hypothetical protein
LARWRYSFGRLTTILLALNVLGLVGCQNMRPVMPGTDAFDESGSVSALVRSVSERADTYDAKWKSLEEKQWLQAEYLAASGGVGAAGVLAQSTPVAATGVLVAGYVGVVNTFYGLDKQNAAYTKSAHGLRCAVGISAYIAINESILSGIDSPESAEEDAKTYVLRKLRDFAEGTRRSLEDQLRIRAVIHEPDWTSFQAAVKNAATSKMAGLKNVDLKSFVAKTGPSKEIEEAVQKAVGRYEADLATCKALN